MLSKNGLRILWYVAAGWILLVPLLSGRSLSYRVVAPLDSNRWVHFLLCAAVCAIPIIAWRRRRSVLLSLSVPLIGIMFEFIQPHFLGLSAEPRNTLADLFGIGAGILLGLNLRMMRAKADSPIAITQDTSRSSML